MNIGNPKGGKTLIHATQQPGGFQTPADNVWTTLTLDTAEHDTKSEWDGATYTATIHEWGIYRFDYEILIDNNGDVITLAEAQVQTSTVGTPWATIAQDIYDAAATYMYLKSYDIVELNAGDTAYLEVRIDSAAGNARIFNNWNATYFTITQII